jgi:hypothetical protein
MLSRRGLNGVLLALVLGDLAYAVGDAYATRGEVQT